MKFTVYNFDENNISKQLILKLIQKHAVAAAEME